jgi:hypothetical protein
MQRSMRSEKNEHGKNFLRDVFGAVAGLAITRVFDPATAQQLVQNYFSGIAL